VDASNSAVRCRTRCSRFSFSRPISSSARLRSVISVEMPAMAYGSPAAFINGNFTVM
jgi:hypothetical protein